MKSPLLVSLCVSASLSLAGCAVLRTPAREPAPRSSSAAPAPGATIAVPEPPSPAPAGASTGIDRVAVTSFDGLRRLAALTASAPYAAPDPADVPAVLRELNYDQYRDIRFDPGHAWWGRDPARPFQLQFFHPGFLYNQTVRIDEIADGTSRPVPFDTDRFNYGKNRIPAGLPDTLGFTGFRVHHALNNPDYLDELIVFQGASYFRALGRGMFYGLSARGVAINTAGPSGEEFPAFTRFWVRRPDIGADTLDILALLDGPSLTGAYRFTVRPGEATVIDVEAELHPRKAVDVLGVAPLTSMFWYGENSADRRGDFRPEVHDSDGLLINRGDGEWLWRPLENPPGVRVADFADHNPRGFGLVQRDRAFGSYEDLEAHYHDRPSLWVEPVGDWGAGRVRLVELPTPDETNDNIVAFWVPDQPAVAGRPLRFAYRLHWFMENHGGAITPPAGYTKATRIGSLVFDRSAGKRFVIDFAGDALAGRLGKHEPVAELSAGDTARIVTRHLQHNPHDDSWRLSFLIESDQPGRPVELRAYLRSGDDVLTETWSYRWIP
ncbi:MAG: glucan biosynthesis protein [Verrucomicrobiota bacterium]